jgi:hypothetical protein
MQAPPALESLKGKIAIQNPNVKGRQERKVPVREVSKKN